MMKPECEPGPPKLRAQSCVKGSRVTDGVFPFLGYGLRCHRAIITICRLIGIKDMYAKVSGSLNMLNLTRGLFHGLSRQVTLPWALKQKLLFVFHLWAF